ncbi:MAG: winged helix-turn-helix domain-containing protein [candidate division WWE3 bacterium]|nr:winged helix-turn-helix domain-containing protein [candidate division WWE3 bacterium]
MKEKEWTKVFKALGNENRLQIIKLLYLRKSLSVSEIRNALGISYKWTSFNLNNLSRIGILESKGMQGQVFYFLNPNLPDKVRKIIQIFL